MECYDQLIAEADAPLTVLPTITLIDELITDYVLDTDIVVDGRREHSEKTLTTAGLVPIGGNTRPVIRPGTRFYIDEEGAARLCPPLGEPQLERKKGCVIVRRKRREVVVVGDLSLLWRALRLLDGMRSTANLLSELPDAYRAPVTALLTELVAAGAIDISGRPIANFIHTSTKKGVLPGGGLKLKDVLHLVTDGNYRAYPDARRIVLGDNMPPSLIHLRDITASRRSFRDYNGSPIQEIEFTALLKTACGVTGALEWEQREVKLRAYPSSGGLYSVEIYPVIFAVNGIQPAICHYCPVEHSLEVIQSDICRAAFLDAALPTEREMLSGVAAMICLTGFFPRHERKYGEGGYRMMAAEAGHISQNIILAATALGLDARPFGGVYDELFNQVLGLNTKIEQFLLSVIIGHADGKR